jgi:hypothetical protein
MEHAYYSTRVQSTKAAGWPPPGPYGPWGSLYCFLIDRQFVSRDMSTGLLYYSLD